MRSILGLSSIPSPLSVHSPFTFVLLPDGNLHSGRRLYATIPSAPRACCDKSDDKKLSTLIDSFWDGDSGNVSFGTRTAL